MIRSFHSLPLAVPPILLTVNPMSCAGTEYAISEWIDCIQWDKSSLDTIRLDFGGWLFSGYKWSRRSLLSELEA